jgi:hypothetical protein
MIRAIGKGEIVAGASLGLYLLGLGALGGIVYERCRFAERRIAIVRRLEAEKEAWHARMMEIERTAR